MRKENFHIHSFPSGLRMVFRATSDSQVAHCCVVVQAGSRDETEEENGMAHFLEHLLFKGTHKRKSHHILSRIENVGGEINAYTSKEYTCLHSSFLKEHLNRGVDLLADIFTNSSFPERELNKEKGVIVDEIDSYKDQPEEQINDDFEDILYAGHAMGRNILGTEESVNSFTTDQVKAFVSRNYLPEKTVVAIDGPFTIQKAIKVVEKYFGHLKPSTQVQNRSLITPYKPITRTEERNAFQAHCIIGTRGYDLHHELKYPLFLMNDVLGGPGMSSRLNMQIREKYGYTYHIESSFQPYSDTGNFNIYLGTDWNKLQRAITLVKKELKLLREKPLGVLQLKIARQKLTGQIALGEENRVGGIISLARSLLVYDDIEPLETIIKKIENISATDVMEVANQLLIEDQLSMLAFKPTQEN
ncbi:MAG: putative Zn-dependent peptidase [Sphingobacteriales bacterium]|jgi:predicted Zn-dependent peptidase